MIIYCCGKEGKVGGIINFPFRKKTISEPLNTSAKNKPSLDEQFYRLSQQSHTHLQQGKLGLYACDLYSMSEINRKEKDYNKQLHTLIISSYIHLSGVDDLEGYSYWKDGDFSITKPHPLLPPAVIYSTKVCVKRLEITLEQFKELYRNVVAPTLTPVHVFGIEKTLDILCAYLQDNHEKANKMVASGTKKFIKEFSQKR